jgi:uncharacterized delta-60 repeat protein
MKTYTSGLTSKPDWLGTYEDQTGKVLDTDFGFGPDGMYFAGDAEGASASYSVRTNFNILGHQACEVTFTVDHTNSCSDQGICFYNEGQSPNWSWNPHPSRIAFSLNCPTPYILGTNKYVSNGGEFYGQAEEEGSSVLESGFYTFKVTYDPAARTVTAVTYEGEGTLGAVLDTIVLHEKLMNGGPYRIGFDADSDNGPDQPPDAPAYFKSLTINICETNGTSDDTELNSQLGNLKEAYSQVTDLVEGALFNFADDADTHDENGADPNFSQLGFGRAICIQDDGKIVVAGYSGTNDGSKNIRRIDVNGKEDESFTPPVFNGFLSSVVQMSDGRLVVGGLFTSYERFDGGSGVGGMVCLNSDGSISQRDGGDVGFEDRAISEIAVSIYTIKLLDDDSVLVGGHFTHYDDVESPYLAKIGSDGVIDEVFAANILGLGISLSDSVSAIAVDNSGKILVGGGFTKSIIRLNSNGSLDSSFDSGDGFTGGSGFAVNGVFAIIPLTSGKMLVGHSGVDYDGSSCNRGLVRLNNDGSLDNTYAPDLYESDGYGIVFAIAQQQDGKVLVGGFFGIFEGDNLNKVVRLNTDGSLDESFSSVFGFTPAGRNWPPITNDIKLDSDGNVYVAGGFTDYDHAARFQYAKLDTNGALQNWSVLPAFRQIGIDDGMNDLYDGANYLNTNLTQMYMDIKCAGGDDIVSGGEGACNNNEPYKSIPSTHTMAWNEEPEQDFYDPSAPNELAEKSYQPVTDSHVMVGDGYFGDGSSYFTAMFPGMFVLAANNINITQFSIVGNIGADGNGVEVAEVYPISSGESTYTAYLKSNYSGTDPSINHIIIVDGGGDGIEQFYDPTSQGDEHCLTGLEGKTKLFYLIISKGCVEDLNDNDCGNRMTPDEVKNVAAKFLKIVSNCNANYELDLSPDHPERLPNYRFYGEGNMDTSIVVEEGKRVSLQRTGWVEVTDGCGGRKILSLKDGEAYSTGPAVPDAPPNPTGHPTFM